MTPSIGRLTRILAVVGLTLWLQPPAWAQEPDLPEMSDAAKAEMNAWMALRNPGEHHEHLAAFVGKWTSEVKMWMEPGAAPMTEVAATEVSPLFDGRYFE